MTQVRLHGVEDIRIDRVELPRLGPKDVLIKVNSCGICGSDLGYAAFGGVMHPVIEPMPLGHEAFGVISEIGAEVTDFEPGMRVIVNPDRTLIGNGGPEGCFAEFVRVREAKLKTDILLAPDNLPPDIAALAEPFSVAMHGVNRGGAKPGDKVVVYGCGTIGLCAIACLRYRGITDIVAVDIIDSRLERARQFGAAVTVNSQTHNLYEELASAHGLSEQFGLPCIGTDVYIDTAGVSALIEQTCFFSKYHARIVIIAVHKKPMTLDLRLVLAKELDIVGSMSYPANEFDEVLCMLSSDEVEVSALITHRFKLAEFSQAFAMAKDTANVLKVMVEIS